MAAKFGDGFVVGLVVELRNKINRSWDKNEKEPTGCSQGTNAMLSWSCSSWEKGQQGLMKTSGVPCFLFCDFHNKKDSAKSEIEFWKF